MIMTRKEIKEIATKYGYTELSETLLNESLQYISFIPRNSVENIDAISYVLNIYATGEFEFNYHTTLGALGLSSGLASPVTLEYHFKNHEKIFREFVTVLWNYEDKRGTSWRIKQK